MVAASRLLTAPAQSTISSRELTATPRAATLVHTVSSASSPQVTTPAHRAQPCRRVTNQAETTAGTPKTRPCTTLSSTNRSPSARLAPGWDRR